MSKVVCGCGEELTVAREHLGRLARCNTCQKPLRCLIVGGQEAEPAFTSRLSIESGPERVGEQLFLAGGSPITVGKSDAVSLRLVGPMVSRHHCTLIPTVRGSWTIDDHHSTNGLFVNGNRTQTSELHDGDLLDVGDYTLCFHPSLAKPQEVLDAAALEEAEDPDDIFYQVAEPLPVAPPPPRQTAPPKAMATKTCPSCKRSLPGHSKICVDCGIDLKTGKSIQISHAVDENVLHANTQSATMFLSWLMPIGLTPIASEAYGKHKPYAMWIIGGLTVLITVAVWLNIWTDPQGQFGPTRNLMLWTGEHPTPQLIWSAYSRRDMASEHFQEKFESLYHPGEGKSLTKSDAIEEAYEQLDPVDNKLGEFNLYQLLTNIFLHGGLLHLVGNMVFFLVFANRINALVGQWMSATAYVLLGIVASLSFYISAAHGPLVPALGASGAIMGMAGMYLIFFPVSRVYMVFWLRLGLFTGFRRITKIFALRGFWVLLGYIAFDVWATAMGHHDHTAHWAHLGGFIGGMVIALALLITRQVNANGGDLLSLLLGRHAWKLLGTPAERTMAA